MLLIQDLIDKDSFQVRNEMAKAIYKLCSENRCSVDVVEPCECGVRISISWGDWKHDHWRLKYILEENGYYYGGSVVTEDDGSDCYSADHYVRVA